MYDDTPRGLARYWTESPENRAVVDVEVRGRIHALAPIFEDRTDWKTQDGGITYWRGLFIGRYQIGDIWAGYDPPTETFTLVFWRGTRPAFYRFDSAEELLCHIDEMMELAA